MKTSKLRSPPARWSPKLKNLRALSLRQPWAWLVVNGYKDIENRSWRTNHRGPLLIHASSSRVDFTSDNLRHIAEKHGVRVPNEVEFGGIVGVVEIVDCVKNHSSTWKSSDSWGWVIENPWRLPFHECKATVGFFYPRI